jgi:outer membrane beta-barrel protein
MVLWAVPTPALAASNAAGLLDDSSLAGPEEDDDLVIVDDEMEGGDAEPAGDEGGDTVVVDDGEGDGDGDGGGDLFGDDTTTTTPTEGEGEIKQDADSEENQIKAEMGLISVVQRQRMLKKKRFELQPQFGITVNDPYVRHYTIGLDMNYWLNNRMALGLTGTGFIGAKTPRYDNIRFQEGLLLTANKILWQAALNFTYNPFYGKIAIFNRWLLHWEASVNVGAGAMQTRVIPRYESLHDPFNTFTGGGVVGFSGRTYVPKLDWLAIDAGVRTWVYPDKLEPDRRGPDTGLGGRDDITLDDAGAAKDASKFQVAFNVQFFLGVSFFFPTSFEYTTPR